MNCNCEVTNPGLSVATHGSCSGGAFLMFMGLVEQFLRSQCDVQDPCNTISSRSAPEEEYDFIVVGGGSAGSVVASRLSEVKEWKVLLVEAGPNEPTVSQVPSLGFNFIGSSLDWAYHTEPEEKACRSSPGSKCFWPRGKVIGGTSVLNGMMYLRGSRRDFDDWEKWGNPGWSYKNVLPYFLKSEDNLQADKMDKGYHNKGGMLPITQFPFHPPLADSFLEGAKELGHRVGDLNGKYHAGFAIAQSTSKNGIRYSTSRAFLRPAMKRTNLHVMLNTIGARVLIDPSTKSAYGVEIINSGGKNMKVRAKKEIVLSGGAVNSPQLLLLSGVGPKADLAKVNVPLIHDLPGVGKNLHNHVAFKINFLINETDTIPLNWAVVVQYLMQRDGLMSGTGLSQVTGLIHSKFENSSDDNPDLQIFFGGYLAGCAKTGEVGELSSPARNGIAPKRSVSITPTVLHPKSRGYLTLNNNNPLSHPKIFARYFEKKEDVDTLIEGVKFSLKLSKTKALEKYGFELDTTPAKGCESLKFGSDEYWECAIYTNTKPENHQAGSCKMGPSKDKDAVVDHELKVHGLNNLRVMDASIMPAVTSGNTNGPVIMIAEKGCDMIKKRWLKQG